MSMRSYWFDRSRRHVQKRSNRAVRAALRCEAGDFDLAG